MFLTHLFIFTYAFLVWLLSYTAHSVCCGMFMICRYFRPAAICLAVVTVNIDVTGIDLGKCRRAKT